MRKNQNLSAKITPYKFLVNGIKGFVLATIPIITIDIKDLILGRYYSYDFLVYMGKGFIMFGFLGIVISIIYTYSSKFYPRISKYTILAMIIGYYVYTIIFFIIGIYFHMTGPLFG